MFRLKGDMEVALFSSWATWRSLSELCCYGKNLGTDRAPITRGL